MATRLLFWGQIRRVTDAEMGEGNEWDSISTMFPTCSSGHGCNLRFHIHSRWYRLGHHWQCTVERGRYEYISSVTAQGSRPLHMVLHVSLTRRSFLARLSAWREFQTHTGFTKSEFGTVNLRNLDTHPLVSLRILFPGDPANALQFEGRHFVCFRFTDDKIVVYGRRSSLRRLRTWRMPGDRRR